MERSPQQPHRGPHRAGGLTATQDLTQASTRPSHQCSECTEYIGYNGKSMDILLMVGPLPLCPSVDLVCDVLGACPGGIEQADVHKVHRSYIDISLSRIHLCITECVCFKYPWTQQALAPGLPGSWRGREAPYLQSSFPLSSWGFAESGGYGMQAKSPTDSNTLLCPGRSATSLIQCGMVRAAPYVSAILTEEYSMSRFSAPLGLP